MSTAMLNVFRANMVKVLIKLNSQPAAVGYSIKPGVERGETPGSGFENNQGPRSGRLQSAMANAVKKKSFDKS